MNTTAIAAALRALADAIETPPAAAATVEIPATATSAQAAATTTVPAAARPRGRPPGAAKPAAPAVTASATPSAPIAAAPVATPGASGLTHAAVANDFKAAALAHGRDFVKGLLTAHGAATFDKVKDLAAFQAQLKAGPLAAAPTVDASDLLG